MTSIWNYIKTRVEPEEKEERRKLNDRTTRYTLIEGELFRRLFMMPYLKCLDGKEVDYTLREVHKGIRGNHLGAKTIAHKLIWACYYWLIMKRDITVLVQKYKKIQKNLFSNKCVKHKVEKYLLTIPICMIGNWSIRVVSIYNKPKEVYYSRNWLLHQVGEN